MRTACRGDTGLYPASVQHGHGAARCPTDSALQRVRAGARTRANPTQQDGSFRYVLCCPSGTVPTGLPVGGTWTGTYSIGKELRTDKKATKTARMSVPGIRLPLGPSGIDGEPWTVAMARPRSTGTCPVGRVGPCGRGPHVQGSGCQSRERPPWHCARVGRPVPGIPRPASLACGPVSRGCRTLAREGGVPVVKDPDTGLTDALPHTLQTACQLGKSLFLLRNRPTRPKAQCATCGTICNPPGVTVCHQRDTLVRAPLGPARVGPCPRLQDAICGPANRPTLGAAAPILGLSHRACPGHNRTAVLKASP